MEMNDPAHYFSGSGGSLSGLGKGGLLKASEKELKYILLAIFFNPLALVSLATRNMGVTAELLSYV